MAFMRVCLALGAVLVLTSGSVAQATRLDLIIRHARVVDGTGSPWYRADVGVQGDAIVAIGDLRQRTARRVIDARDRVVTPGFIDLMGTSTAPLLTEPNAAWSRLYQGITTMMVGEGGSEAPQNERTLGAGVLVGGRRVTWRRFREYFALLEGHGVPMNVAHNVGAAQVRELVMGVEDRKPSAAEMTRMKALVDTAMIDGAVGISTALIYPPGAYATTEELIDLSKVAAARGGVYFSHMRNESAGLLDAIREVIRIAEGANIPAHIYHLKAAGQENWPLMPRAIAMIGDARARGLEITADIYPYIRNGIGLGSFLHPRHYARGEAAFIATLSDSGVRRSLRQEVESTRDWENWYRHVGMNWDNVLITGAGPRIDQRFVGLSIRAVAATQSMDEWNAFFDLVMNGPVDVAPQSMNEEQKQLALRAPFVANEVDSPLADPATTKSAHPRAFGAFPRVIAKYVREDKVLTLEQAVQRMTALPANILRLRDRGRIAPGMKADLLVFHPDSIQDRATFERPLQYATGIDYMFVNGVAVIDESRRTSARAGRVLRRSR
ncbi:MAG: N-acyl-D-amino-acid deacylase family protein [Gemmatimonadaceae bacterium]